MDAQALIVWLIVGAIAGWLAGMAVKGGGYGLIGDIIVGIVGGLIAGWLLPQIGIVIWRRHYCRDHQRLHRCGDPVDHSATGKARGLSPRIHRPSGPAFADRRWTPTSYETTDASGSG
jgi:uncharacterized membrane protein YeaQ/YmgE (transglycosylase-associated protein family)